MADRSPRVVDPDYQFSLVLIPLLKDVVYRHEDEQRWNSLLALQPRLRKQASLLNAELYVDEAEGYAFMRSRAEPDPDAEDAGDELPRLVRRYSLSYPVSLLLALLRKKLAEFDAGKGGDGVVSGNQLVLSRDEILETMRVFLADSPNEAKLVDQLESNLAKIEDMKFIRRIRGSGVAGPPNYEVRRILKAFVDAQWLAELLETYKKVAQGDAADESEGDDNG